MVCTCTEYLKIGEGIYHDEHGNPTLSLMYIVYCDHMGSAEQVMHEIPLEMTWEEWRKLPIEKRVATLKTLWRLTDEQAKELATKHKIVIREYRCPYCEDP